VANPEERYLFTSESVTEGHPDKIADQISDAVLDSALAQDPMSRVACECILTTGIAFIAGEITTKGFIDFQEVARHTIREIGYNNAEYGFDSETCSVLTAVHQQSGDIAMGVDTGGAGDQGMMFGYASDETEELMPLAIMLAHRLTRRLAEVRKNGSLPYLRPDGKSQVTVEYRDGRPVGVETVVVSTQHAADVPQSRIREEVMEHVIHPVLPAHLTDFKKLTTHINPTGQFIIGGPHGDTGLTGRKIIVDTYGGSAPHGGGAFSGKDPTKVDRSACYMARYIAKNIVSAGLAHKCQVQLAYAIGVADPVSVLVETFGTGSLPHARLVELVREHFKLTPKGIIESLNLRRPIYRQTAAYGHFGRQSEGFSWEATNVAGALRTAAKGELVAAHK
jgi:S-adenosylmethionine synthetase